MPRKYKPVPECPTELAPIIYGVNLLPRNALKLVKEVTNLAKKVNESAFMETWAERDKLQSEFAAVINNKKLSDLLIGESKILRINEADEMLRHLEQSKRILHYIAKKNHQQREQVNPTGLDRLKDYYQLIDLRKPPHFAVYFRYDEEKGLPIVKKPPLLELIEKGNAESFDRVALCPMCKNIYWLRKTNSKTCGERKCVDDFQNQIKKEKIERNKK